MASDLAADPAATLQLATVQPQWASLPIAQRLLVIRRARSAMAGMATEFASALSPSLARTPADTMVAELLPLLEAMRFLERRAQRVLRTRRLGRRGLPVWLTGIDSEIERVPFGEILVIAPSNYPLFLAGVQAVQALVAGNAVTWKPGTGGGAVADLFASTLVAAGLPQGLLRITAETVEATWDALSSAPAKVFFTGSAAVGRILQRRLAETSTPCVMELSGCDAVAVLPSAELDRVVTALAFGMRLNGSATCMAPRRVLLIDQQRKRGEFLRELTEAFAGIRPVRLAGSHQDHLRQLLAEAQQMGATLYGDETAKSIRPLLLTGVKPTMRIAHEDLFAPVLLLLDVAGVDEAVRVNEACPYALTVSLFGEEREARRLAARFTAGTVIINDLIVPTADPRVPFGGRKASGFGVTRGSEGLLEMTAVKVVSVRRNNTTRHYEETNAGHQGLFAGLIRSRHAGNLRDRLAGFRQMAQAAQKLKK